MSLELSIFRFDKKTDYLPYYKKYKIPYNENESLKDVLHVIKFQDPMFDFPTCKNAAVVINQKAVNLDENIKNIVKDFGKKLSIDPLSQKRSTKDLKIDTDDFDEIFYKIDAIAKSDDKDAYDKYIRYFYISSALTYDKEHFGTSAFLHVNNLIKKYPHLKHQLLCLIADENHGIWYHNCCDFKIYPEDENTEEIISNLKWQILQLDSTANEYVGKKIQEMKKLKG